MLGALGAITGGLGGLWSAITGANDNKRAVNHARDINRYTTFTGKTAQEPTRQTGGLWNALVGAGKGALGGYISGLDSQAQLNALNKAKGIKKIAGDASSATQASSPTQASPYTSSLPKGVERIKVYADPSQYNPVDAANRQALAGQTVLWNTGQWGPIAQARQKMKGMAYSPYNALRR